MRFHLYHKSLKVMAARGALELLCLFALDLILCDPQHQSDVVYTAIIFAAMNESVTFPVEESVSFKEILWKKGQYPVIKWEEAIQPEPRSFPPFIGRTFLDTESGNLTIFNLTYSDEDEYELESSDIEYNIKRLLKVIDPLPSVTLNCTWTGENITVQCGLKEPYLTHADLLEYLWLCSGAPCSNDTELSEMYFEKNRPPEEITCVVRNPLSERKSSMDAATCFPGKQLVSPDRATHAVDHSRSRWALLPAVLVVCLLAAIGGCICMNSAPSVSAAPVAGTGGDEPKRVNLISSPPSKCSSLRDLESGRSELLVGAKKPPLELAAGTPECLSQESVLSEKGDTVLGVPSQTPPYHSSSLSPAGLGHLYPGPTGSLGLPEQLSSARSIPSAAEEASPTSCAGPGLSTSTSGSHFP